MASWKMSASYDDDLDVAGEFTGHCCQNDEIASHCSLFTNLSCQFVFCEPECTELADKELARRRDAGHQQSSTETILDGSGAT